MELKIKAFESKLKGVKAAVTVGIDGIIWINGVLIRQGNNGDFVCYPSYKSGDEYKSYIMAKKEFSNAILNNYEIGKTVDVEVGKGNKKVQNDNTDDNSDDDNEETFPFC